MIVGKYLKKRWIVDSFEKSPPLSSLRKIVNENLHVFPFHPDNEMALWWSMLDALDGGGGKSRGNEREFNGVETGWWMWREIDAMK